MHALTTKQLHSQSQQNIITPKNSLKEHRWHFATALIVPYYQLQVVIVRHRVWYWQLTRHALNIKKTWGVLFDCLYRLSKLVEIQMINVLVTRNSSEDEIRELSLRRHRTRTTKYNRLVHKFHHRSTRLCVGTHVYQCQWNNATQRPLRCSRSFKVTDFGTNRKLVYDSSLVINTNLPPILHRFQVMADYWSNFR